MEKSAVFSLDRKYRYALFRVWNNENPYCMFIGLNPSTADEYADDPTIRRCMSFAGGWGYGGIAMTNLFAYVSTNPDNLLNVDAIGEDNDSWLTSLSSSAGIVIACWGHWDKQGRDREVMELIPVLLVSC